MNKVDLATINAISIDESKSIHDRIVLLTNLHNTCIHEDHTALIAIENAIEDLFGIELRRLNTIREKNLEVVTMSDIQELKTGYAQLYSLIDQTLQWNLELQRSLYGVINRAALRSMLIDPSVSVKQKQEIMNNWEKYL